MLKYWNNGLCENGAMLDCRYGLDVDVKDGNQWTKTLLKPAFQISGIPLFQG
jgi:hypothetical protein